MAHHRIDVAADNVHWGYFDGGLKPILTIDSGDSVTISTVSGGAHQMPPPDAPFVIPEVLKTIHTAVPQRFGPHICTGPVAVRGAKAGDVLEVRIKTIDLHYDWGYTVIRPGLGALPDDFPNARIIHVPLDARRMTGRLPWGAEIPLRPFFGIVAVAPAAGEGAVSSVPPRQYGGNIDLKELTAGATLYLPIKVDGALFSIGDAHGAQGDGEVCITALETGLIGTFELRLRKDMSLEWPLAETPTHWITMAFDPDLDRCAVIALRQMIRLLSSRAAISDEDAYILCSLAADLRVTQLVNESKGIHVMLEKSYFK